MSTSSIEKGNSFLTAYLEANKKLIQTLVIKSDISVFLINESIRKTYGDSAVDQYAPETWKYYLNLAGQPHFTDVYMNVISLDTLEVIAFTPENLKVHTATARAYQFGTRYFYSLLKKFPQQEAYIMGVLNPVNIWDAIDAENGSILGYDAKLVEEQEHTLIEDLETYIKGYFSRWTVPGYQTTDEYYSVGLYFVLSVHCYNRLLNLRQERCHTNEVHSFHIREYLASHGGLDKYIPYLTLYQKLYLYRNIRYLEHHSGSVEQFRELTEKILTIRNVPLAEYTISQINEFTDDNYIKILAKKKDLGTSTNGTIKEYFDVGLLQDKIEDTTSGNPIWMTTGGPRERQAFKVSNSSVIRTKSLESTMVDFAESVPDPMVEILLRQWAYMSHNELYPVLVYYIDPVTGDYRNLDTKEAWIYFNYISLCSAGVFVEKVPKFTNVKFRRHPRPSVQELLKLIPKGMEDLRPIAYELIDKQPVLTVCKSVSAFYEVCQALYEESQRHWYLTSSIADIDRVAVVRQMILKLYGMQWVVPEDESMDDWLSARKLPKYNYSPLQAEEIMGLLLKASTGYDSMIEGQLKYIQKNLLQLFGQLSSYSVQFLSQVNQDSIIPLNWSAIRVGNVTETVESELDIYNGIHILEHHSEVGSSLSVKNSIEPVFYITDTVYMEEVGVKTGVNVNISTDIIESQPVVIDAVRYEASYPEYDPAISKNATYIGAEFYAMLTEDQRKQIKSF